MGEKGRELAGPNVDEIIARLNKAYADEWLAYYQYWVGAKVVKGRMRPDVEKELEEHAKEELEHAEELAKLIIQMGGKPLLSPKEVLEKTNCGYKAPENPGVKEVLKQNIDGERCAIKVYKELLEFLGKENDHISAHEVIDILEDEVEHEEDLENLLEDIESI
jgi:bacterioferritin